MNLEKSKHLFTEAKKYIPGGVILWLGHLYRLAVIIFLYKDVLALNFIMPIEMRL